MDQTDMPLIGRQNVEQLMIGSLIALCMLAGVVGSVFGVRQ